MKFEIISNFQKRLTRPLIKGFQIRDASLIVEQRKPKIGLFGESTGQCWEVVLLFVHAGKVLREVRKLFLSLVKEAEVLIKIILVSAVEKL